MEAASIFGATVLIPCIGRHTEDSRVEITQLPAQSMQEDSSRISREMKRFPKTLENRGAQDEIHPSADFATWELSARKTHMAAYLRSPEMREWKREPLAKLP